MGYSNKHNKFGGGRDFKRREFEEDRPSRREGGSFKAICSKCGKQCELPFKPNGSRPVYCAQCFRTNKPFENERPERREFDRPRYDSKPSYDNRNTSSQGITRDQYEALNAKLDRILKIITPANLPKLALEMPKEQPAPKQKKTVEAAPVKIEEPVVTEAPVEVKPKKKTSKKKIAE